MAYGGEQPGDKSARVVRFANRVPLLYQQGACASTKAITSTTFRSYGLSQSKGSLPIGPLTIAVHIASVWVPFTSESKEAIAHYPEIIKEMKLALQEAGRKLGMYVNKKKRIKMESKKRDYIETFIPHVADTLIGLTGAKEGDKSSIEENLRFILEKTRGGKLEKLGVDNPDYDEDFAKIGKDNGDDEGGDDDE
jgi:DNA topoisomerase-6 subunit B